MEELLAKTSSIQTIGDLIVVLDFLQNARLYGINIRHYRSSWGSAWDILQKARMEVLREFKFNEFRTDDVGPGRDRKYPFPHEYFEKGFNAGWDACLKSLLTRDADEGTNRNSTDEDHNADSQH